MHGPPVAGIYYVSQRAAGKGVPSVSLCAQTLGSSVVFPQGFFGSGPVKAPQQLPGAAQQQPAATRRPVRVLPPPLRPPPLQFAVSVVQAGWYEDDHDDGEEIIYTGRPPSPCVCCCLCFWFKK